MNIFESTFEKHKKLMLERLSPEFSDTKMTMSKIMKMDFGNQFVSQLKQAIQDPKVQQFLTAAKNDGSMDDDKIYVNGPIPVAVKDLYATQNEVFLNKSLEYPLENKRTEQIKKLICPPHFDNDPKLRIVISGNYVIDGHHRWSQIFCWSKEAKIPAYNITYEGSADAGELLKKAHLGVAASKKDVPLEDKPGVGNLFSINQDLLTQWLVRALLRYEMVPFFKDPQVLEEMKKHLSNRVNEISPYDKSKPQDRGTMQRGYTRPSKEEAGSVQDDVKFIKEVVGPYIWSNAQELPKHKGAYPRRIMPQAGDKAGSVEPFVDAMRSGDINIDVDS